MRARKTGGSISLLEAYDGGRGLDQPALARHLAIPGADLSGRELAAGDTLGAYRILEEIGHGGMGTVYLAGGSCSRS